MKAIFKDDKREYEFDCDFDAEVTVLGIIEAANADEIKSSEAAKELRGIVEDAAKTLPERVSLAWVLFAARTIAGIGEPGDQAEKNDGGDS